MTRDEYIAKFDKDDAVGWNSISQHLKGFYGDEKPLHWAASPHYSVGGTDPIDGIDVYMNTQQTKHHHFISYGMSSLYYNPDHFDRQHSKWGFEFTFRFAPYLDDKNHISWVYQLMNNLARYVFKSKKWFEEGHVMPANGPIKFESGTDLTGLIFVKDPILGEISTPNGQVTFLQIVGITTQELEALVAKPTRANVLLLAERLQAKNDLLITDLQRT